MSRIVKIIFTVSVILNVGLIGITAGHAYQKWKHSPAQKMAARANINPEARKLMKESFANVRSEMKQTLQDSRKTRQELVNVMKAKEFDAAEFDRIWTELEAQQISLMRAKAMATKEVARQLSTEDRQSMARHMIMPLTGGKQRQRSGSGSGRSVNIDRESGGRDRFRPRSLRE